MLDKPKLLSGPWRAHGLLGHRLALARRRGSGPTTAGDWDLAAVFGDMLHASATGGNFLLDILPSL